MTRQCGVGVGACHDFRAGPEGSCRADTRSRVCDVCSSAGEKMSFCLRSTRRECPSQWRHYRGVGVYVRVLASFLHGGAVKCSR